MPMAAPVTSATFPDNEIGIMDATSSIYVDGRGETATRKHEANDIRYQRPMDFRDDNHWYT